MPIHNGSTIKKPSRTGPLLRGLLATQSPVQWYTLTPLFIEQDALEVLARPTLFNYDQGGGAPIKIKERYLG